MIIPFLILLIAFPTNIIVLIVAIKESIRDNETVRFYPMAIGIVYATILTVYFYQERNFLGHKVLKAEFIDDMSRVDLALYRNGMYRVGSDWMFGEETFEGKYKIEDNRIIFDKQSMGNDFIPRVLMVSGEKIYFRNDSSFYYFKVTRNEVIYKRQD